MSKVKAVASSSTEQGPEHILSVDVVSNLEYFTNFIGKELSLNSLRGYLIALSIAVVGVTLIWAIKGVFSRWAANRLTGDIKDTNSRVDPALARQTAASLTPLLYLFPLLFAVNSLAFSHGVRRAIAFIFLLFFITRTVHFLSSLAALVTDMYLRSRHKGSLNSASGKAIMPIIRMVFWVIGITFLLDSLGFQVSNIVAGLGIAGIAIGLAAQATLSDFFAYLVIILDQPFTIGDTIGIGDITGTVESVGLKTTRIRTSGGELLVCPNSELTKQRLSNFRSMRKRTRRFSFGVQYETPLEKVRAIPKMVREAATALKNVDISRVHLTDLGAFALNFEVVITIKSQDLSAALSMQESLMLALMERFKQEGIGFAYPTQTLYLAGGVDTHNKTNS